MTDRFNAFIVVLAKDIREDDAQATIKAIKQIKGVLRVTPHTAGIHETIAETRVRTELGNKLWEVLYEKEEK